MNMQDHTQTKNSQRSYGCL